jgi:hypothetical protein
VAFPDMGQCFFRQAFKRLAFLAHAKRQFPQNAPPDFDRGPARGDSAIKPDREDVSKPTKWSVQNRTAMLIILMICGVKHILR